MKKDCKANLKNRQLLLGTIKVTETLQNIVITV